MAEVLRASSPLHDADSYFSNPLMRTSPSHSSYFGGSPPFSRSDPTISNPSHEEDRDQTPASEDSSPPSTPPPYNTTFSRSSSFHSTIPSSISLDRRKSIDEEIEFPCYGSADYLKDDDDDVRPWVDSPYPEPSAVEESPSPVIRSTISSPGPKDIADDSAIREEPSEQVDYLSHDWREEDIWSSWKHIVSKRKLYGETSRLENASWRTWAKAKYRLKTVSPETLNWLKDVDVTWLYGPLQQAPSLRSPSEPPSRLSKTNSFLNKKPILKKRNLSEVMLQKSLSASSLVKQAAASVQAQRSLGDVDTRRRAPVNGRIASDVTTPLNSSAHTVDGDGGGYFASESSSGLRSPEDGKKHISFNEKVEQCIAVDFKQPEAEEEDLSWMSPIDESSEDELVMRTSSRRISSNPNSRRNSFTQESKTIQILAPTKLKYHKDSVGCQGHPPNQTPPGWQPGRLSQSSSQETLRPSRPNANFLLEDDDDADMSWEPSGAFSSGKDAGMRDSSSSDNYRSDEYNGMRRTPSGMFMPFDDDEDNDLPANSILGRFVDTVNTAKDIAHVIWNVGWRQ